VAQDVFHTGPTGQSEFALATISFVFIWLPIIFSCAMAALLFFYKLDKEYPSILEELKARKEAVTAQASASAQVSGSGQATGVE
jgi:GPH family glycoside/pentoside/hexuronide:cation symporter